MVVTLTATAKNWLAINAGVNNCFSPSGVSYVVDGASRTGSTGDVVNALYVSHLIGLDNAIITAGMDYIGFKIINGGVDLTMGSNIPGLIDGDVKFAYANDGTTSGIPAYCAAITGVAFTSTPTGATIYIDGSTTSSGTTPATITGLATGSHTYKLTYSGYVDATGPFTIVTDQVTNVDVTLIEKGAVFISSTPPGASIYINNAIQSDVTPATIAGLAPGSYTYKLRLSGYRQATGTFIITSGGTTPVSVTLTVEAEEAGMGLLMVGLIFGTLLMGKKKKKEDEKKLIYY